MTKLSIVILSYNTKDYLRMALRSIERAKQKDWEVLVVDNASHDGSPEMVKEEFPFAHVIKNKENVGFGAGNNVGIKQAKGQYVLLLNSDAELVLESAITPLLDYMDNHEDVAVVTPKVVLPDGSMDKACHRGAPTPWNALCYFFGLEKVFGSVPGLNRIFGGYHQTWKNLSTIHEIDACTAAAMVVRATALDEVGLFDERFFMYAEDIDWCLRFKEAGWKIIYNPQTRVLHHKNKSGIHRETKEEHEYAIKKRAHAHFFDTMIQFYEKHYLARYPQWVQQIVYKGIRTIQRLKGA